MQSGGDPSEILRQWIASPEGVIELKTGDILSDRVAEQHMAYMVGAAESGREGHQRAAFHTENLRISYHDWEVLFNQRDLLPSPEAVEALLSRADKEYLRQFSIAIMNAVVVEGRQHRLSPETLSLVNGWFATMEELDTGGALDEALSRLALVQDEADDEGEQIPDDTIIAKTRQVLLKLHPVAKRRYGISSLQDGAVVIEVASPFGSNFVLIIEAEAGAHCLMTIGDEMDQRKYTDEELASLPDDFVRSALDRLPKL